MTGGMIGHFEITAELGQDGMAVVHQAADFYRRFVHLYRDCDERFGPHLEKAEAWLAALEGGS